MGRERDPVDDVAQFIIEQKQSEAPRRWEGQEVLILVIGSGGYDQHNPLGRPSTAVYRIGTLEEVNELGIYGMFRDHSDDPNEEVEQVFYSWGGVVSIKPFE